jgi:hypothetical protein
METSGELPDRVNEGGVWASGLVRAFREGRAIDRALREAVRKELEIHKSLGLPVVVGRDGKAVWIPADQISIED